MPFFGGPDDRLALDFFIQICANARIRGTVVKITKSDNVVLSTEASSAEKAKEGLTLQNAEELNRLTVGSAISLSDTIYGQQNTEIRVQSDTADNIAWARYTSSDIKLSHSTLLSSSASRPNIEFKTLLTPQPLSAAIKEATAATALSSPGCKLMIVSGRSRRLAVENHRDELKTLMDEHGHVGAEVRKTVGDVATAFVVAGVGSGIVVVQAATL